MAEPVLRLDRLEKSFGALKVSDAVSFHLAPGEIHALIGPNGAGKTSLIAQIAGTLLPDRGRITLLGQDVTHLSAQARARLGLARTFQITSIFPSLDVRANVALAAQARLGRPLLPFGDADRDPALNEVAMAALDEVGLAARADVLAGTLSHGEKRALEIAMVLARAPKLILFDEPLAGMGREESARILTLIGSLKGRFSMLLVEHDMAAVFSLADQISVLLYGRVLASGLPAAIRADPAVRAAYLGEEAIG